MIPNETRPVIPLSRDDYYREVKRLRDEVATLEEEKRLLIEMIAPSAMIFPRAWILTRSEIVVLSALVAAAPRGGATMSALLYALGRLEETEKDKEVLRIHILRLRRKLAPYGITIDNIWGSGYSLPPTSLNEIRAAIKDAS